MIVLLWLVLALPTTDAEECIDRCERLKQRALERVALDNERLHALFEKQRPLGTLKDVCWRLYDNLDCMKRCPTSKEHNKFAKLVKNKCKFVLREMESDLHCVSRHHSFLNVRCKSFVNEAASLRQKGDITLTPDRETCRFLHLNTLCLENAVGGFCPNAKTLFRRVHFRDYFLNFLVPEDDTLFDDQDLDYCQMYNFLKARSEEEDVKTSTAAAGDEDVDDDLTTIVNELESTTTKEQREFTTLLNELLVSGSTESTSSTTSDLHPSDLLLENIARSQEEPPKGWKTTSKKTYYSVGEQFPPTSTLKTDTTTQLAATETAIRPPATSTTKTDVLPSAIAVTTTTTTKILEASADTTIVDSDDEKSDYEEYNENYSDVDNEPNINLVPIENRQKEATPGVSVPEATTKSRSVFSDDSLENTPPNFFYSSLRNTHYSTSTRPNERFVSDNTNLENSREDPTLEIDTTTLFGMEDETRLKSTENARDEKLHHVEVKKPIVEITTTEVAPLTPLLHGGVVVKPIRKWTEPDSNEEEVRRQRLRMNRDPPIGGSNATNSSTSDNTFNSRFDPDDQKMIVLLFVMLTAVTVLSLVCACCFVCCRSKKNGDKQPIH